MSLFAGSGADGGDPISDNSPHIAYRNEVASRRGEVEARLVSIEDRLTDRETSWRSRREIAFNISIDIGDKLPRGRNGEFRTLTPGGRVGRAALGQLVRAV